MCRIGMCTTGTCTTGNVHKWIVFNASVHNRHACNRDVHNRDVPNSNRGVLKGMCTTGMCAQEEYASTLRQMEARTCMSSVLSACRLAFRSLTTSCASVYDSQGPSES